MLVKRITKFPEPLAIDDLQEVRWLTRTNRGVFAKTDIPAGTQVALNLVVYVSDKEVTRGSMLSRYVFDAEERGAAFALGLGSMYNHHRNPNVEYDIDIATDTIEYRTCRDVKAGEELTIYYGNSEFD